MIKNMANTTNPLDIIKRLDVKQNVTIRVIDEPTGKVVQEHIGHNAATNSLLTGIAHYLMGDGVLNQGSDILSMWVPQYISLGTMGLTSQESETIGNDSSSSGEEDAEVFIVPKALGYTPVAPESATDEEKELNAQLRFEEYINQTPGFGADGYDENTNNNREWFGLGYPYSLKPDALKQDFYTWDGSETTFTLSDTAIEIVSATLYPDGVVNQDISDTQVERRVLSTELYSVTGNQIHFAQYPDTTIPTTSRLAIIYTYESADAANCELVQAKLDNYNNIVPLTLRSKISYRDLVPEVSSEVPNTLDVIYSAMISTGALADYRGDNDYIYVTEAGLWAKPNFNDSGDNGLLAGYRIVPSDDEVNILGAERIINTTGDYVYALVDENNEPLSILSIDSITCDSTKQMMVGDGNSDDFELARTAADIISVTIDDTGTTAYTIDSTNNHIIFDNAPAVDAKIAVVYQNSTIPSDEYTFKMTVGETTLTFENGYIPVEGQTFIMVYRSGDVSGTWKDMTIKGNREKVQKSIIRIGPNQVAQIVWKIQLGGLEQLGGLRYLYPAQYPQDVWTIV